MYAHLLLGLANAMQPGVFQPIHLGPGRGAARLGEGGGPADAGRRYGWISRGGVELTGARPDATESAYGLPKAEALFGPLPPQLKDPDSLTSRLERMLAARKAYRVAEAEVLAALEPKDPAVCLLVLRLPGKDGGMAVTALNSGR